MLTKAIGVPAMLEQTAEECAELAQACLKMARHCRGENKVYKPIDILYDNLAEEIADVQICIMELLENEIVSEDTVNNFHMYKTDRMEKRLLAEDDEKEIDIRRKGRYEWKKPEDNRRHGRYEWKKPEIVEKESKVCHNCGKSLDGELEYGSKGDIRLCAKCYVLYWTGKEI